MLDSRLVWVLIPLLQTVPSRIKFLEYSHEYFEYPCWQVVLAWWVDSLSLRFLEDYHGQMKDCKYSLYWMPHIACVLSLCSKHLQNRNGIVETAGLIKRELLMWNKSEYSYQRPRRIGWFSSWSFHVEWWMSKNSEVEMLDWLRFCLLYDRSVQACEFFK